MHNLVQILNSPHNAADTHEVDQHTSDDTCGCTLTTPGE